MLKNKNLFSTTCALPSFLRFIVALMGLNLTGCSHYMLPGSRLDSPEVAGPERIGRLEWIGPQTATNLTDTAEPQAADAETGEVPLPKLKTGIVPPGLQFSRAMHRRWDVSIRIAPYLPVLIRIKNQLLGDSEEERKQGSFSVSWSASGGYLASSSGGISSQYIALDAGLMAGYRLASEHLIALSPYLMLASISGTAAPGSTKHLGLSLLYQHDIEGLFYRIEPSYVTGGSETAQAKGFQGAILFGLKL